MNDFNPDDHRISRAPALRRRQAEQQTERFTTASKDAVLAYPQYTDRTWYTEQLLYGRRQPCGEVAYLDRLVSWNPAAATRADAAVTGMARTARAAEAWLTAYHERQATIRYILGSVNWSSGFPVYVYGYDLAATEQERRDVEDGE